LAGRDTQNAISQFPELHNRWQTLWRRTFAPASEVERDHLFGTLARAYSQPHRAYHTLDHVAHCLSLLDEFSDRAEHPEALAFALWFHDAVYDLWSAKNEERSANWAAEALSGAGASPEFAERVWALILDTRHDAGPYTPDGRLIADIDLAILGAAPERYREYEERVAREYRIVPRPIFRRKRAALLEAFLRQSAIYHTDSFRERFEDPARKNLAEAVSRLRDG
jgi:predicted metal-dependent HD superfamily phosphohydrolase